MNIETVVVGPLQVNCYLVWEAPRKALVIDPGWEAGKILSVLERHRLSVAGYLLTHAHADHLSALAELHQAYPAFIGIHADDLEYAFSHVNIVPPYYPPPKAPAAEVSRVFRSDESWTDAGLEYQVIPTPGHSPGGVSFYFPNGQALFSGDTLFAGSVGRTDLPGGNPRILARSLARLATLPDETKVYPGHGPSSTIGIEKAENYFLQRSRQGNLKLEI